MKSEMQVLRFYLAGQNYSTTVFVLYHFRLNLINVVLFINIVD